MAATPRSPLRLSNPLLPERVSKAPGDPMERPTMTDRFSTGPALLIAAALLATPAAAFAQAPQTALARPSAPASVTASAQKRNAMVEQRISHLRTEIKITPDEQKSFDDFANVMRQNAAEMDGATGKGAALPASASAVDRMTAYSNVAQTHAQNMQQLTTAFTTFYNTLTPQQKKVVDTSFAEQSQKMAARRAARS